MRSHECDRAESTIYLANLEWHAIIARIVIPRRIESRVLDRLKHLPAVALLGPRQVGKTTLALRIAERRKSVYLDLESPRDREKLADAAFYLSTHEDELVILDEVQRTPELFAVLRGLIDEGRRKGKRSGAGSCCWARRQPIRCGSRKRWLAGSPISKCRRSACWKCPKRHNRHSGCAAGSPRAS